MDIWSWISELPDSEEWAELDSSHVIELASSVLHGNDGTNSTRSILLKAERTSGSNSEALVTFSVSLQGFLPFNAQKTLWVSEPCSLSSEKPFLPLLLQLVQEIISRSPTTHDSTCPKSQLQKLKPEPLSWIMDSHSPESFSGFFNLVFITRLFWLCACDAPCEVGSIYFHSLLAPTLEALSSKHAPVLRTFLIAVGVDTELCFMRTLGYILAKWRIFRDVAVGLQTVTSSDPPQKRIGFSYAKEAHGFWALKGYVPVNMMRIVNSNGDKSQFPLNAAKDAVLKYALSHQQLEATIQMEYSVGFYDGFIQVNVRVDNIRIHVAKLGFSKKDDVDYAAERHFPSRIRVWVGPEIGATYVSGLSLGRSTDNCERDVELQNFIVGNFGKAKVPEVKATARTWRRTRTRNWRMDQEAEGNAGIFDVVLHDNVTGEEVATVKPTNATGLGFRRQHVKANRPFTRTGGLVVAGDEYGEVVAWRLSKEMEGNVLKWRIGGQVWVSYWPNEVKTSYFETRCVEWCEEVDLSLIPGKVSI